MEYQSLKKLKRMDILEMLIAQVEENERLLEKMDQLHFQLERQKTLSPREAGTSGSTAFAQNSVASAQGRAMGRSQGFASSAGYAGSAGMGSTGSMLGGSAALSASAPPVSSTGSAASMSSMSSTASARPLGSAGSLRSASGMKAQQSFAAGKQGSLSSAAPYAAGSSYQSASYASTAQSDPYAPASQANSYAQTSSYAPAAQSDPYAPAAHADPYAQTPSNASASRLDPYAPASQPAPYRSAAQADPYAQTSQAAPYAAVSQTDPYASDSPYYASAAQPAPYATERESGRMSQPDLPREGLNHPDLLREELYGRQPLSFGEKDGPGVLPSFLQEMPREDQEDFSCSRVQLGREAQAARSAAPYYKQNVVPLNPSLAGARTVNFAPASAAASFAAGAGTPAAARQSQVRPLPFAAEAGNAAADKVNRSHA